MATIIGNDFSDLQAATTADYDARTRRKAAEKSFLAALSGIMAENRRTDADKAARFNDARVRESLGMSDIALRGALGNRDIDLRGELGRGDLSLRERLGLKDAEIRDRAIDVDESIGRHKLIIDEILGQERNEIERERVKVLGQNPFGGLGPGAGGIMSAQNRAFMDALRLARDAESEDAYIDDDVRRAQTFIDSIMEDYADEKMGFYLGDDTEGLMEEAGKNSKFREKVKSDLLSRLYQSMPEEAMMNIIIDDKLRPARRRPARAAALFPGLTYRSPASVGTNAPDVMTDSGEAALSPAEALRLLRGQR